MSRQRERQRHSRRSGRLSGEMMEESEEMSVRVEVKKRASPQKAAAAERGNIEPQQQQRSSCSQR